MTTQYAPHATRALATVKRKGAAITFALVSPGVYDAATDTWSSPVTTSIAGFAVEIGNDPEVFRNLGLILADHATFLFTASTLGSLPVPGFRTTWGGAAYTVKSVLPLSPDGTALLARVIASR